MIRNFVIRTPIRKKSRLNVQLELQRLLALVDGPLRVDVSTVLQCDRQAGKVEAINQTY